MNPSMKQPAKTSALNTDDLLSHFIFRLDPVALGIAVGAVAGLGVFLATALLLLKSGAIVGPNLALLGQFMPGYTVSWPGSLIGMGYGVIGGLALGWFVAILHNSILIGGLLIIKLKAS